MLKGNRKSINRPLVIGAPVGKGHVFFFATNPLWRQERRGNFSAVQ
jgi:hypothetical protein